MTMIDPSLAPILDRNADIMMRVSVNQALPFQKGNRLVTAKVTPLTPCTARRFPQTVTLLPNPSRVIRAHARACVEWFGNGNKVTNLKRTIRNKWLSRYQGALPSCYQTSFDKTAYPSYGVGGKPSTIIKTRCFPRVLRYFRHLKLSGWATRLTSLAGGFENEVNCLLVKPKYLILNVSQRKEG